MKLDLPLHLRLTLDEAWTVFNDAGALAKALPGSTVAESDDDSARGTLTVDLGMATVAYRGAIRIEDCDVIARSVTLRGIGQGEGGEGMGELSAVVVLREEGPGSVADVSLEVGAGGEVDALMSQEPAALAERLGAELAARLAGEAPPDAPAGGEHEHEHQPLAPDIPEPERLSPMDEVALAGAAEQASTIEPLPAPGLADPSLDPAVAAGTDPDAEPEPVLGADPQPALGAVPEPVLDADPEPAFDADPEPVLDAEPEPALGAVPEPVLDADPEPTFDADPPLGDPSPFAPSPPLDPPPLAPEIPKAPRTGSIAPPGWTQPDSVTAPATAGGAQGKRGKRGRGAKSKADAAPPAAPADSASSPKGLAGLVAKIRGALKR